MIFTIRARFTNYGDTDFDNMRSHKVIISFKNFYFMLGTFDYINILL